MRLNICDASLAKTIRGLLEGLGVHSTLRGGGYAEVCITDGAYPCQARRVIRVPRDPLLAAARIIGFLEAGVREVLVGVDTGPKITYAIIVNDVLVEHGSAMEVATLAERLCRLQREAGPRRVVVRVGAEGLGAGEVALTVKKTCPSLEVELSSEHQTTRRRTLFPPAGLVAACRRPLSRDAEAAVMIALKPGLRLDQP